MDKSYRITDLSFSHAYFEDEVREGFFVPNMMKRFWAAQLEVLKVFSEVCDRNGIIWYMGDGSLIGAVRHKGYIPWDDDLDVYIHRKDAMCFKEAVKRELSKEYRAIDVYESEEMIATVIRFVNGSAIRDDLEYLTKYHGCPYVVGIDVFMIDNVFDDPEVEAERIRKVTDLRDACRMIQEDMRDSEECKTMLKHIAEEHGIKLEKEENLLHKLLCLKEDLYASCTSETTKRVAVFWEPHEGYYYHQREWFDGQIPMPFETITVPAPVGYDSILREEYGDYLKPVREGAGHTYPCYEKQQKPLEEVIKTHPYCYTFQKEDLLSERQPSRRTRARRVAVTLADIYDRLDQFVALGVYGERIAPLRDSCEKLENTFAMLTEDTGGRDVFDNRKEVVFLVCREEWWKTMEPTYRRFSVEPDTDVYVMVVPWFEKQLDGTNGKKHDEMEQIAKNVPVTPTEDYSIATRCPDVIVTQFPYDGWNRTLAIPPFYHTDSIRRFTDKLIYIPCYDVPTPTYNDDLAIVSLQSLIEQPAVMFADEIRLPDEGMRTLYIEWLCKLDKNLDVREVCEKRFVVA